MSRARPLPASDRPAGDTLAYVRVSTEAQAGEHRTSPAEQRRAIAARAEQLGRAIDPALVFEDLGVSGATAEGRPGFMALVRYCEERPRSAPGVVLVLNDSRFGRFDDPEEATHWRFVLKRLGWIVRFCEGDDVEDGVARGVLRFIGSAQASEYRANLKRTARRATRATAEQGRWQNRAPMGLRRLATRIDGSTRVLEGAQRKADDETVRLALGPADEVAVIRFCFEAYADGQLTMHGLARALLTRWPGRRWSQNTVNALLKNPAYVGDVVWCRRAHDAAERRVAWMRSPEHWVTVRDAHPGIVSRELFARVQRRLALNKKETRATAGGYPLSGFIRCAACNDRFVGYGGRVGPADDPDRWRKYQESTSARPRYATSCPGGIPTLRKRWLEPIVVEHIATVAEHPRIRAAIAAELDRVLEASAAGAVDRTAALRAERTKLQEQRQRLVDAIARDVVTDREAQATLTQLRGKLERLEAELERTQFNGRRTAVSTAVRDRVLALATDFRALAAKATGAQLRELVRPWLADAVFDKQTYVLTLRIRTVPDILGAGGDDWSLVSGGRGIRDTNTRRDRLVVRKIQVPRRKTA